MASKSARSASVLKHAAFYWITQYGYAHHRLPRDAKNSIVRWMSSADLRDIVDVQADRNESRALDLIRAIVAAPIPGDTLSARYLAFWAWWESQRPKRYTPASRAITADNRRCIRGGA